MFAIMTDENLDRSKIRRLEEEGWKNMHVRGIDIPSLGGPHEEKWIQTHCAVKDVASCKNVNQMLI